MSSTYDEAGPRMDKLTFSSTSGGKCSAKTDSKLSNLSSKLFDILSKIRRRNNLYDFVLNCRSNHQSFNTYYSYHFFLGYGKS